MASSFGNREVDEEATFLNKAAARWTDRKPEKIGIREKIVYFRSDARLYMSYIRSLKLEQQNRDNLFVHFPKILKLVKGFHVVEFYKLDYYNRSLENLIQRLKDINKIDVDKRKKAPKRVLEAIHVPKPSSTRGLSNDQIISPTDEGIFSPRRGNLALAQIDFPVLTELEDAILPKKIKRSKFPRYRVNENEEEERLKALLSHLADQTDHHLIIEPIERLEDPESQLEDEQGEELVQERLFVTMMEPNVPPADEPFEVIDRESQVAIHSSPSGSVTRPASSGQIVLQPLEGERRERRPRLRRRLKLDNETTIQLNIPDRNSRLDYNALQELAIEDRNILGLAKEKQGLSLILQVRGFSWEKRDDIPRILKLHDPPANFIRGERTLLPELVEEESRRIDQTANANQISRDNDSVQQIPQEQEEELGNEVSEVNVAQEAPSISKSDRSNVKVMTFADLYPPATTPRHVAAKAFADLLKLQKEKKVNMVQHVPFVPIEIHLLN